MRTPTSFNISGENYEKCIQLVESGEFNSVSEVIAYAMRFCSESLRQKESEAPIPKARKDVVKISMRVDNFVADSLDSTGYFERPMMADQCILFYMKWREGFKN